RSPPCKSRAARSCRRTREARTNRMDAKANYNAPPVVERYRRRALIVGVVGLLVGAVLAYLLGASAGFGGLVHVFRAYLVAFVFWFFFASRLNRWPAEQDHTGDPRVRRRMQDISGPIILLFGLTVTFAAVDWGMSLEPHWFSTIYGLIIMAGWGLSALAFMITIATVLSHHEPMEHAYQPLHFHDWGKLLLAMVMLYAYFAFSQFLITWAGNLPEEIPFYLRRLHGGWQVVGLLLILFHFALPFVLLLSRQRKREPVRL